MSEPQATPTITPRRGRPPGPSRPDRPDRRRARPPRPAACGDPRVGRRRQHGRRRRHRADVARGAAENVFRPDETDPVPHARGGACRRAGGRAAAVQRPADPGGGGMSDLTRLSAQRARRRRSPTATTIVGRGHPGPPRPHRRRRRRRPRVPACRRRRARSRRRPPPTHVVPQATDRCPTLLGVPIAVKDVVVTKGLPTTAGSRILEGWVPPYDATLVARLRERRSADPRQDQHGRVRDGQLDRALGVRPDPQPVGPRRGSRAAPAAARRPRSPRSRRRSRSAPTPAARSGSRRPSPARSASSRRTAASLATA